MATNLVKQVAASGELHGDPQPHVVLAPAIEGNQVFVAAAEPVQLDLES